MEFCEGGSVGDILKITDKPFTEDIIALICRETLLVRLFMNKEMISILNRYRD